jgi:hypothetical protein
MRFLLAAGVMLGFGFLSCTSNTTVTPGPPWGTLDGGIFAPVDGFLVASTESNGDYNLVVIVADQLGYCTVLQENVNGLLANMNYVTLVYANPVGSGAVNPGPGIYPVTLAPDAGGSTAQASFASSSASCVTSQVFVGTTGTVTMQDIAFDLSQMDGALDVGFGDAGTLSGSFSVPFCDLSLSFNGPNQCFE